MSHASHEQGVESACEAAMGGVGHTFLLCVSSHVGRPVKSPSFAGVAHISAVSQAHPHLDFNLQHFMSMNFISVHWWAW